MTKFFGLTGLLLCTAMPAFAFEDGKILIWTGANRDKAALEAAAAKVKQAQVALGDTVMQAPFDGIIVTAAPDHIPRPLLHRGATGSFSGQTGNQAGEDIALLRIRPGIKPDQLRVQLTAWL